MASSAGGAIGGTIGSILGSGSASGDYGRSDDLRNQALQQLMGIEVPDIEKMKLALENYTSAGNLTPEAIALITQGDTALANVSTDPRLRNSQLAALDQISGIASTGMSEGDQAAFELARRNAAAEGQAKQGQILQNMAQRGVAGSGAELAASLQNAQSTADRLQQAQLEEAKARQAARMAALQQQANMAGNLRSADYTEASNVANARDEIARFNAANAQQVNQSNVGARNQAQATNLQNQQNIRNQNTALANQQQQYNKGLLQQDYNNQLGLGKIKNGVLNDSADAAADRGDRTVEQSKNLGAGVGTIAGAIFGGS